MRKCRVIESFRCYHLISRLAHQAFFLDDGEKTRAVELLRSGLDVEVVYDDNGLSCLDYPLAGTSDWGRRTKTFTVPEQLDDKIGHLLRFRLIAASGTVWIDGIRLEEVR